MRKILLSLFLFLIIGAAWASDISDADAAHYRKDYVTALEKYKSAAAGGSVDANYQLADMYRKGQGVRQDNAEAQKLYRLAAVQGHLFAQLLLGKTHRNGEGVAQDYAEAVKWYRLAAAQNYAFAEFMLGSMYYRGEGVIQDYVRAHSWFNLSAAGGNADAVKARDQVAKKMTTLQVAEAQKMARDCLSNKFKGCD